MKATRRDFLVSGVCAVTGLRATALRAAGLHAPGGQFAVGGTSSVTRLDLAKIDHDRIRAGAAVALGRTAPFADDPTSDAFLQMTLDVPALAAAAQIDPDNAAKYAGKAETLLTTWFGAKNRMQISGWEDLLNFAPVAEIAVCLPFVAVSAATEELVKAWFRQYLDFLTGNVEAGLARDAKDRHGSSWLLQVAAAAKLCADDKAVEAARVRFRHATLRAEINAEGFFAHDLSSANPFRNSLMNLDLLAGVCVLLSTRFESLWDAELQDRPGMRAAVARHAVYIGKPVTWPYPADAKYFLELPGRRPALAFAARAYAQPEYAALFLTLKETTEPELLRATPIRQPLLWVSQPRRRVSE